jgi:diguanylate cyclase (GGDEF)-like protein
MTLRVLPFAGVAILAQASAALPPGPASLRLFTASTAMLVMSGLFLLFPWRRFPAWTVLVPTAFYLVSVGFLLVSGGTNPTIPSTVAGLSPIVLMPVIGVALFHQRLYSLIVIVGVLATITADGMAMDNNAATLTRKIFVYGAIGGLIAIATLSLRTRLENKVTESAEFARQSDLLSIATRRLTSLLDPDRVISEGVRILAEMASPPGSAPKRATYLQVEDGMVIQHGLYDDAGVGPIPTLLADNPYVAQAFDTGEPGFGAINPDQVGPTVRRLLELTGVTHAACMPVRHEGKIHGILVVTSRGLPFDDDNVERCQTIWAVVELALSNALTHQLLELEAITDHLTGLANRRGLALAINERPLRHAFAVLVMDLDNLKAVNDTYGHDVGDELIVAVADAAARSLRGGDVLARTGGDEFAIYLADAGGGAARRVAYRVMDAINKVVVHGTTPSLSVGLAWGEPGMDAEEVSRNADAAMYKAKAHGGSQVVTHHEFHAELDQLHVESREVSRSPEPVGAEPAPSRECLVPRI